MPELRCSAWVDAADVGAIPVLEAHRGMLTRLYLMGLVWTNGSLEYPFGVGAELLRPWTDLAGEGVECWLHLAAPPGGGAGVPGTGIEALASAAREAGVRGLCLDGGVFGASGPGLPRAFSRFASVLSGSGLKLGLVVRLKSGQSWPEGLEGLFASDTTGPEHVQVLTEPGFSGPWATEAWMDQVLAQAGEVVPAGRLEWTLPALGALWQAGAPPREFPYALWAERVRRLGPERRDPAGGELVLPGPDGTVWINDAISLTAKLWTLRRRGVRDVALWRLGAEDPRLWALLETLPVPFL